MCRGWGYVARIYVTPPHIDPCLSYKGGIRFKEEIDSVACLLHLSLLILPEDHADPFADFSDSPLGPLPAGR